MPIFPVLETEDLVQESDKTRLDGSKSFVSGTTAITQVEIRPTKLGSYVDVTNSLTADLQYLDWMFDFKVEVDTANNKLDFKEGSTAKVATLATGQYTLAQLATEIGTKMTTAGTQTYSVAVSAVNELTISAATAFSLLVASGANAAASIFEHIGFTGDDLDADTSHQGDAVEEVEAEVTLKVTNGSGNTTKTKVVRVVSSLADGLWSTDDQLRAAEFDIMKYVPSGRATWKHMHRAAQTVILEWLDREGFVDVFRDKLTKAAMVIPAELNEWSKYATLRLIFESLRNSIDDVFAEKAKHYGAMESSARQRAVLRLDLDGDGAADEGEEADIRTCIVVRR